MSGSMYSPCTVKCSHREHGGITGQILLLPVAIFVPLAHINGTEPGLVRLGFALWKRESLYRKVQHFSSLHRQSREWRVLSHIHLPFSEEANIAYSLLALHSIQRN